MRTVTTDNREDDYKYDFYRLTEGKACFIKDLEEHCQAYVCRAQQSADDSLELTVYFIETPYVVNYRIFFGQEEIQFDFHINVSMTLNDFRVKGALCHQL